MRGVRFTKDEVALLRTTLTALLDPGLVDLTKTQKWARSILRKLEEATVLPGNRLGVAAGPLQDALMDASRGKVVRVEANGYGRISRQATALGATVDQARVLGNWLASQKWLTGPLTIFTVLNKWPDWLARAKATAAPDGFEEGLGGGSAAGHVGQGPGPKRPASTAGRRRPGLGQADS